MEHPECKSTRTETKHDEQSQSRAVCVCKHNKQYLKTTKWIGQPKELVECGGHV